jgi:hypothetical protein
MQRRKFSREFFEVGVPIGADRDPPEVSVLVSNQ